MDVVAHRAGNTVDAAQEALGKVDMIELDVHVLRGRVEVRHEKVLHPTRRLWEKWYLLPRGARGVPIEDVLGVVERTTPLMIDLKCFTRRSALRVREAIPPTSRSSPRREVGGSSTFSPIGPTHEPCGVVGLRGSSGWRSIGHTSTSGKVCRFMSAD